MSGSYRVYRGGSWSSTPQLARVAFRYGNTPGRRHDYLGFRLVRIITPAERLGELSYLNSDTNKEVSHGND